MPKRSLQIPGSPVNGRSGCKEGVINGPYPQYGPMGLSGRNSGKIPGKTPEMLSERFLEFPSGVRLGSPKSYNSRHLRLSAHFQNSLTPSTAGGASFFRSGSGKGLSELVMEFPAVLGAFLNQLLRLFSRKLV